MSRLRSNCNEIWLTPNELVDVMDDSDGIWPSWRSSGAVISEAITGDKISLDADWYNRLMVPIGLFLLFLTGVGPLFAWRRTSGESLRRNFMYPGIASVVLVAALVAVAALARWCGVAAARYLR